MEVKFAPFCSYSRALSDDMLFGRKQNFPFLAKNRGRVLTRFFLHPCMPFPMVSMFLELGSISFSAKNRGLKYMCVCVCMCVCVNTHTHAHECEH